MEINVNSVKDLDFAASQLLKFAGDEKLFLLYGNMGAGKTTFINKVCQLLGTKDHTSSPSFSIVNEYKLSDKYIYHFDFYRLKNQNEAFDLGYEDYFYSDNYCFVEWPEKIPDLLPETYVKVVINVGDENIRTINFSIIKN